MKNPDISIIVPVFNEAENIKPLYETLKGAMEDTAYTWETAFDYGCTEAHKGIAKEISFSQGAVFVYAEIIHA